MPFKCLWYVFFIQQGFITFIKSDSKDIYHVLYVNVVLYMSSTTLFNIDNNHKCFLSSKS